MRANIKKSGVVLRILPLAFAMQAAYAQESVSGPVVEANAKLDEVIVTGVAKKTLKRDSTNTVNTISAEEIRKLAPISTADLLQNVPGVFAEGSTAGEASNNITVRGLPVTGGYRYAPQLIDGLPWFEEPEVQFMNNDVAVRDDLMTKRIEVVKGGTGGVLYSNGLGATFNHVTRTGSQKFEGGYKVEATDYNLLRNDFFVSGPVNQNLTFAVGGFNRTSNGIRDTGYTADRGGQMRGNLVYRTDDDRTEVQVHALRIEDRTAFFQNLPFQVPGFSKSGTPDKPTSVSMNSVWPIGIDFEHGTVASPYNRVSPMLGEYGSRNIDTADGIHPKFDINTFKFSHEFDSGWTLDAGVRSTSGTSGFTAMFTGNDTTTADRFNNARFQNDLMNPALGQALALAANPSLSPYSYAKLSGFFNIPSNPAVAFNGISKDQLLNQYGKVTGVGAFYVDGSGRVPGTAYLDFLLPFVTNTEAQSSSTDIKLSKSFDWEGKHQVTVGGYSTAYSVKQNFQSSLLVSTIEGKSKLVNLRGIDSAGNAVGPSLTLGGAILPGFFGYVSDASVRGQALYMMDHWEAPNGKLKLDVGLRHQSQKASVVRQDRGINAGSDMTPATVVPGSAGDTTADNEVQIPGTPRYLNSDLNATGWSIGGNYSIQPDLAVYGLVSSSFRLPSMEDLNEFKFDPNGSASKIERIMQYETGVRYYADTWDTQVAVFANNFSPREQVNVYRDINSAACAVPGGIPNINACPEVREYYKRGVQNLGMEVEAAWRPRSLKGLELRGNVVLQNPKITDANYTTVKEVRSNDVVSGYVFEKIGEDGRAPRRLADVMVNLQGSWDTMPYTGVPFKPYAKYTYFGERYSESTDNNVTLYPAYYHLDAGFIWDFDKKSAFQLHVANLTNQLSFTEGDPLFSDLKGPNGATNRGVARPLFGRTIRAMYTYIF